MPLNNIADVELAARRAVETVTISDIHTHLFPPSHQSLLAWGVDEILTYHYLVAELFMQAPLSVTPEAFWKLPKRGQADLVWEHVFLRGGAISEAARGALTALTSLGLDVSKRDLKPIRAFFDSQKVDEFLPKIFKIAGLDYAVMTNNPFDAQEVAYWEQDLPCPEYLKPALRVEALLLDWPGAAKTMRKAGYKITAAPLPAACKAARKFLADWTKKIRPMYLAASMPSKFRYPAKDATTKIMDNVIVPAARELGLPVALMVGTKRQANPALGWAGDAMGECDVDSILNLVAEYPDVKFAVTVLARTNQQELCVVARKFRNLHVFGCWWFCNNPSIIEEIARMRLELLGTGCTLQHSDSRVFDQLIYKWKHSRQVIAKVLSEKYRDLYIAGWRPTEEEIRRDARKLLGGGFEEFCSR